MDPQRFDMLARGLAAQGTRRSVLRGFTGLVAGGVTAVRLGHSARFARALQSVDLEEQAVVTYEEMARIAHDHVGNCADLGARLERFGKDHAALIAQIKADQDGWSYEKRVAHADTYGDRREAASDRLQAALTRCRFSTTAAPDATPVASPVAVLTSFSRRDVQGFGLAGSQQCSHYLLVTCVNYRNSNTSPLFHTNGNCNDNDDCTPCLDASFCAATYPDVCLGQNGINLCFVDYANPAPPDYCHQTCPIGTGDCILNWAGGLGTSDDCLRCESAWCGSTSTCLNACEDSDGCNTPCSEAPVPPHGH